MASQFIVLVSLVLLLSLEFLAIGKIDHMSRCSVLSGLFFDFINDLNGVFFSFLTSRSSGLDCTHVPVSYFSPDSFLES